MPRRKNTKKIPLSLLQWRFIGLNIDKLWQLATSYLNKNDFGVAHTRRVYEIAKQNFDINTEFKEITYASIILHDIGGSTINDQYEKGPQIAGALLKQLGATGKFIGTVCMIVGTHHEHPVYPSLPFQVLYDSDKLAMFSIEEYPYYNSQEGFDWDKIVNLIYSEKGRDLARECIRQRITENQARIHDVL